MATLSAVLIVKNEQERIGRCLKTLRGVDQIVVLDTGSVDDTVEEANQFGADVHLWAPPDPFHFADARNVALSFATSDWVLSIDADETLRPGSLSALRPFLSKNDYAGYRILHLDRGLEDFKFRVFRREKFLWNYRVHEVLKPQGPEFPKVGILEKCVLEHLPKPGREKDGRNFELLRLSIQESPEHHAALMKLGMELFIRDDWEGALGWFGRYLAASGPGPMDRSEAMARAGLCLARKGQLDEALKEFERSYREAPYRREPLWYASLELIKAAKVTEAVAWLNRCLQVPLKDKKDFYLNIPPVWDKLPVEALAWCEGQLKEAERKWRARTESK